MLSLLLIIPKKSISDYYEGLLEDYHGPDSLMTTKEFRDFDDDLYESYKKGNISDEESDRIIKMAMDVLEEE